MFQHKIKLDDLDVRALGFYFTVVAALASQKRRNDLWAIDVLRQRSETRVAVQG